jgi:hypothetical protein
MMVKVATTRGFSCATAGPASAIRKAAETITFAKTRCAIIRAPWNVML